MRKILLYCTFVIASLVVIVAFLTAETYIQLALAIALYPPLVYFAFKLFLCKTRKVRFKKSKIISQPIPVSQSKRRAVDIVDLDKRTFLKLIGITGISFFFFSVLTKRVESLFFEKLAKMGLTSSEKSAAKEAADSKVNPANAQCPDDYQIAEIGDGENGFYGFTNREGGWFVMKEDPNTGSFRYAKGNSNFSINWRRRESLKYNYYHKVF